MKIAIPHWQGRVSPVFDAARALLLVEVDGGREVRRQERSLVQRDPRARAAEVVSLGVNVLICGAISALLETRLAAAGVRVAGFVCGAVDEVLDAWLSGRLDRPAFRMPGCGRRRRVATTGKETGNMPFGDGTGPFGQGPMTGRGAGFCGGRGGGGRGGRGRRWIAGAPQPGQDAEALKQQAQYLENALQGVRSRLQALEPKEPKP